MQRKWIRNRHSGCPVAVCLCMLAACLMMACCVSALALNTPPAGCSLRTKVTKEQYQFPLGTTAWRISEEYGWRKDPLTGKEAFHKGVDLACASGTIVLAGRTALLQRHATARVMAITCAFLIRREKKRFMLTCSIFMSGRGKSSKQASRLGQLGRPDGPPGHISTWNGFATASAMTQPGYFISYETTFPYREDFFSGPAYSVRSLSNFALF